MNTITLSASARYGYAGKQFVARITGRHPKYTFEREFVGRKSGKRGESTTVEIDEPGLYQERDIDSKGRVDDTYYIVAPRHGELVKYILDHAQAMGVAKDIDAGSVDFRAALVRTKIANVEAKIAVSRERNPDEHITLKSDIGGLANAQVVTRAELIAEREKVVAALRRELAGDDDQRAAKVARVTALMAELGITLADLGG